MTFINIKSKAMKINEKGLEKIPTWALSAIINGDNTGLEDSDIKLIEDWFAETGYDDIVCPTDEEYQPYFTHYPAFGKATDVVDCICVKF